MVLALFALLTSSAPQAPLLPPPALALQVTLQVPPQALLVLLGLLVSLALLASLTLLMLVL